MKSFFDLFLKKSFLSDHRQNRMQDEGNLQKSRDAFLKNRPANLNFLLEKRFKWMNQYVPKSATMVIELGAGGGFSKLYVENKNLKVTDVVYQPWLDQVVDANQLPFEDESVDVFICSHAIHHLANPGVVFNQISKKLKPNGVLLINEIETSLMTRFILKLMRHEGWSYDIDVFDELAVANNANDPWSANCAVPELLFKNVKKFEYAFPKLKISFNRLTEFSIFLVSGGVIAKSSTVQLPRFILSILDKIDTVLICVAPRLFAMGRQVVIVKKT